MYRVMLNARHGQHLGSLLCGIQSRRFATVPSKAEAVRLLEVGPRDGLQNIKQLVPTPMKVELIQRLHAARLCAIEPTSFVSPKWIPQLADSKDLMHQIAPLLDKPGMRFPVLVPNMQGFEEACASGAKEIVVFASASEGFSRKNTNCSIDEALQRAEEISRKAIERSMAVRGVVSCIFACPYDGTTQPTQVLRVVRRFLEMGCFEVGLGDTLGVGTPADVRNLLQVLLQEMPASRLAGHYHDTYGQAIANVVASYELGLRAFDSSIAGLGGCPYARGAKGNLATEDIVYTLERSGVSTGIDLDQLVATGEWISQYLQQPNGSRAGSALYAKDHSTPVNNSETESGTTESRPWQLVQDTGEYTVSRDGSVVKIVLTRPKNGNAMTNEMVRGLTRLFREFSEDKSVFHIILASQGKFFCTGMDLSASGSSASTSKSAKGDYYAEIMDLFGAIDGSPQTVIAMIDGPCYGGGVGLAFACDIRLASNNAKFTLSEVKLGVTPAIISKYMTREWGTAFVREAMLTGREIKPNELHRIGALHAVTEDTRTLEATTDAYLRNLASCAPEAASEIKELVRLGWSDPDGDEQSARISKAFSQMMAPGSEGEYGMRQFRKKIRKVDWRAFHRERKAFAPERDESQKLH